jgi:hypothetical protein
MTNRTPSPSTSDELGRLLDELAWAIERDGIERHEAMVSRMANRLRAAGAGSALLDLVADPGQPAPARERAYGRLGTTTSGGTTRDPRLVVAA